MKTYIIIIAAASAFAFGAFFAGARIERAKCNAEFAIKSAESVNLATTQIEKNKRKINAETFNTGVSDIRIWLRQRYTIAN